MSVNRDRAWESLKKISFIRVTGTEEEKRAADIIQKMVEDEGVKVWQEPYEIDRAEVVKASLSVDGQKFPVMGIMKSGNTPKRGVKGQLFYMESDDDTYLLSVKDKICLIATRVSAATAKKLKKAGAKGYIAMHGSLYDDDRLIRDPRPATMMGASPDFPGVSVHMTVAEKLVQNYLGKEVVLINEYKEFKATAQNVVALIPGTRIPDEEVLLSAHYDSVPYSSGAWDNASGSITILELLRHYKENPGLRTTRFVWCGSEEIGLVGSRKYCEAHKDELDKVIYNLNYDMAGVSIGYNQFTCSANASALHQFEGFAKQKGWPIKTELGMASSDSSSFAAAGVPASYFGQLSYRGGSDFHSYRDCLERMDPDTLIRSIEFARDYSEIIVNAIANPIPRTFDPEITKKIEARKEMMAKMMGEESKKETKPAKKKTSRKKAK
jgi:aminopeptidase YwaD